MPSNENKWELDVLTKKGLINVNSMAVRLQKIFPNKPMIGVVQRIIFLIMKDLSLFSDELILEFVKRPR